MSESDGLLAAAGLTRVIIPGFDVVTRDSVIFGDLVSSTAGAPTARALFTTRATIIAGSFDSIRIAGAAALRASCILLTGAPLLAWLPHLRRFPGAILRRVARICILIAHTGTP